MKQQVEVCLQSQQPYTSVHDEDLAQYPSGRLDFPNRYFDPVQVHGLYTQYHEQYAWADEVGLDGIMPNEIHASYWNMQGSVTDSCAITPRWKGAHSSRAIASKALAGTHRTNHIDIQQVVRQSRPGSMTTLDKLSPSLTRMIRISTVLCYASGMLWPLTDHRETCSRAAMEALEPWSAGAPRTPHRVLGGRGAHAGTSPV